MWVINSDNLVVAMVIRELDTDLLGVDTSPLELKRAKRIGIATPIAAVLEHLNISIPDAPNGWSATPLFPHRRQW